MNRWFHFHFRFQLAEGNVSRWWLDIAILDTVVRSQLSSHRSDIALWRVHRRSTPSDEAGHQFTFLVYTTEQVAVAIDQGIQSTEILQGLESHRLLRGYHLNRESGHDISFIEGTSDKNWPPEIQKAWPHYIMGVSEMLLDLVSQLKRGTDAPGITSGFDEFESYYDQISKLLAGMWQQHGSHAFLHHLNALFGYHPIIVQPRTIAGVLMTL